MRTRVSKWGHSLAVRIPRAFAEQLGVTDGSAIEISADSERVILEKPKYDLQDLLDGVTPENLHGETDFGAAAGGEEW
ncbi:MAG: AbrB/MazE/SpoVT family DNA-binding domain-containing protein [Alphaproteobacteria bacterium]|nr:AbrB/MazE/SpoVT family DNA-binding domain-containing protein [Alphaproteobacteria bacterium]